MKDNLPTIMGFFSLHNTNKSLLIQENSKRKKTWCISLYAFCMVLNQTTHDFLRSTIFSKFVIATKNVFLVKNIQVRNCMQVLSIQKMYQSPESTKSKLINNHHHSYFKQPDPEWFINTALYSITLMSETQVQLTELRNIWFINMLSLVYDSLF